MIGQTVANYRILEYLGDGASGSVYSAEDLKRHRLVAVKIISSELARDEEFCRRLESDLGKVISIDHPGIPRLYEQGLFDATRFIAMQLLDGQTLENRLKSGPIPLAVAVQIGSEVAEALGQAHARGLVHRDLKPNHIVLTAHGIKLLGLGHTPSDDGKTMDTDTRDFYVSPEQALGRPADARSDIFSLGVIVYEMVSRQRPFSGENAAAIRKAILSSEYEPVTAIVPNLPHSLERVIGRALQHDPDLRYQTVAEFLAELREAGRDLNALLLASAPLTRRRRRHFGTLLPTAATILLLLLIWLLWNAWKGKLT